MKALFILLVSFFISIPVWSTEQMPDVFEGKEVPTEVVTDWSYLSPLEHYFHRTAINSPFEPMHTANYRGHVAHWALKGNQLLLTKIMVEREGREFDAELVKYDLSKLFNAEQPKTDVAATWFSGALLLAVGPHRVDLEGRNYKIEYQSFEILWFKNGMLINQVTISPVDYRQGVEEFFSKNVTTKLGEFIDSYYRAQIEGE
jgi:hypothetical protein